MNKEVNVRNHVEAAGQKRMGKRGTSKKKRCDAHHDQTYAKKPERRKEVLSSAHLEGPFGGAGEWKKEKTRVLQRPEGGEVEFHAGRLIAR